MFLSRKIFKLDSEEVVIFAYCLLVLVHVLNTTQFKNIFGWEYIVRGTNYLSVGLVILSFLVKKTITKKVFYISCILSVAGIGIALISDKLSAVVLVVAFFAAGRHIKSDKIFQRYQLVVISVVLFTLVLYLLGIYNYDALDSGGKMRLYLGFTYVSFLSNYFLHILLVYFAVKKRQINVWETVAIILINYNIWILTATRAKYYGIYLFLLFLWGLKLFPRIYQSRIFIAAALSTMPILAVLIIYLSYIFTPSNAFLVRLNKILTNRLSLGHQAIEKYGFTLFGSKTMWVTGRYGIERMEEYFYVDSSYLNIMLSFGVITLLLVVVGFIILTKKALSEQKYILCVSLIILAIHSCIEPQLFDLKHDPFLILIGTAVLRKDMLPLENAVKMTRRTTFEGR